MISQESVERVAESLVGCKVRVAVRGNTEVTNRFGRTMMEKDKDVMWWFVSEDNNLRGLPTNIKVVNFLSKPLAQHVYDRYEVLEAREL